MPIAPIYSPVSTFGQVRRALIVVARPEEVVHEEHRVGEVREAEARVALRQLVVDDGRGQRVHAGAAVVGRDGDAEQAELAAAAEQGDVELALAVVLLGLGLDHVADEVAHHLPEHAVLFGRVREVEGGLRHGGAAYHAARPLQRCLLHRARQRAVMVEHHDRAPLYR